MVESALKVYCDGGAHTKIGIVIVNGKEEQSIVEEHPEWKTAPQLEAYAILRAVQILPNGCKAIISSDSELMIRGLNDEYEITNRILVDLIERIRASIFSKHLVITFNWVPRRYNLAGGLL